MFKMTYWKYRTSTKMIYKAINEDTCKDWNYKEHMIDSGWKQITIKEFNENKNNIPIK